MKWWRVLCLFFLIVLLSAESFSLLKINVEPKFVEMDVSKPMTKQIHVTNQTNEFVRYKISLEIPRNLKEEYYIGDDITIYPRVISLKPKSTQLIRLRLEKPISGEGTEYAAKISFDELKPEKKDNRVMAEQEFSVEAGIEVRLEMYILGSTSNISPDVSIGNFRLKREEADGKEYRYLVYNARNKGVSFFKPRANIEIISGKNKTKDRKFFSFMGQDEERELSIDVTMLSEGDRVRVEFYDDRNPKKIIFRDEIEI